MGCGGGGVGKRAMEWGDVMKCCGGTQIRGAEKGVSASVGSAAHVD